MTGTAVAYDMYQADYSDAEQYPQRERLVSRDPGESETFAVDLDLKFLHVIPLKEIVNQEYRLRLKSAIPVYLESERNQYLAVHEESRICGEGKDAKSALSDFSNAFIEIFCSYRDSHDPLSEGGKDYLEFLSALIENIEKA